ncbi:MAG: DUF1971 domain-containing protein [Oceanococcus sp.]
MKALPDGVTPYQRTPTFSDKTVPAGLLRQHNTKAGVWAVITVLEGSMSYRILEPQPLEYVLDSDTCGIVEPTVFHEVEPQPGCRFYVEFYK